MLKNSHIVPYLHTLYIATSCKLPVLDDLIVTDLTKTVLFIVRAVVTWLPGYDSINIGYNTRAPEGLPQ
jgi:hypothetical protein